MPKMTHQAKKNFMFVMFTVPITVLYILFFIAPILYGVFYSFTDYNGISSQLSFVGLENYQNIFKNSRFLKSILFNIRYSFWLIIFTILFSLILALMLNSKIKMRSFFRSVYFFPAVLPLLTMGLVFSAIITSGIPELGAALGIESWQISLLSRPNTAIYAILFVNIWKGLAIPTVLFLAGLQTIPKELEESASLDGASFWQTFEYITIPFLIPIFTIVFVLTFKQGLMVFDLIKAMTEGGPAGSTESIAMLIYNHGFVERRLSVSMAEALILAVIVAAISIVQIAWSNKKRVY